ncbi:hypothetical protein [Egicoccus sp. AB-alg6-2]|uniref:hypothetical protein n=1 Tax=Egicoccus sp. AB-alg6-2 TaxID=3242692 RepID=UPI00359D24F5
MPVVGRGSTTATLVALAVMMVGCSGGGDDTIEASVATPEPIEERTPSEPPEADPSEAEEEADPSPPPIGDDEPLYAPLPELTPDPDNDIPDDLEQLILDAYADAYNNEFTAYSTGELDEEALRRTHAFQAFDDVAVTVEEMQASGVVERSGDSAVSRVFVRDFQGGSAVLRECFTIGPATGDYDRTSGELVTAAEQGEFARDWLLELVQLPQEENGSYRVVDAARAETTGCTQ